MVEGGIGIISGKKRIDSDRGICGSSGKDFKRENVFMKGDIPTNKKLLCEKIGELVALLSGGIA